jgi:hypothetical protein
MKRYSEETFRTWLVEEPWRTTYRLEHHIPAKDGRYSIVEIGNNLDSLDSVKYHIQLFMKAEAPIISEIDIEELEKDALRLDAKIMEREKDGAITLDHEYFRGKFMRELTLHEMRYLLAKTKAMELQLPFVPEKPNVIIDFSDLEKEAHAYLQAKV